MKHETVAAKDVRVGDRVFNTHGYRGAAWVRVHEVEHRSGRSIVLHTSAFQRWLHPEEAVAVQRNPQA